MLYIAGLCLGANEQWIAIFPSKWRANGQQGGGWAPTLRLHEGDSGLKRVFILHFQIFDVLHFQYLYGKSWWNLWHSVLSYFTLMWSDLRGFLLKGSPCTGQRGHRSSWGAKGRRGGDIRDVHSCIILHGAVRCYAFVWYDMIWYDMIWYDMIWCHVYTNEYGCNPTYIIWCNLSTTKINWSFYIFSTSKGSLDFHF